MNRLNVVETMRHKRVDEIVVEGLDTAGDTEGTIAHVPAGASGDLAEFGCRQPAMLVAVEFSVRGERDVIDLEIQTHPDGVGCDQEIDVARLVDLDLRVAGARAERSQNDCSAAALPADQFGDGVNVVGREGDDGAARRQPRDLSGAGICQHRHARPGHDVHPRDELLDDAAHGRRTEEKRLILSPQVQNPVGENVPPLQISSQLDLVDSDKRGIHLGRHGFHGADPEPGALRRNLFLTGKQCDRIGAQAGGDAAIDFAGQQSER